LATIVELSQMKQGLKVEQAIGVCDSGLTINPNLAKQCGEDGMIFGLSNATYEQITLAEGAPEQQNFDEYQLLRIDAAPDVVCEIISVDVEPGSFGEVGTMPIGTALGNAIATATGKRVRAQPYAANGVNFA
jgi:CO/xanthine dehydrogenase Mo-binding subunit